MSTDGPEWSEDFGGLVPSVRRMTWNSLGLSRVLRQDSASVMGSLCVMEANVLASGEHLPGHPLGSLPASGSLGL